MKHDSWLSDEAVAAKLARRKHEKQYRRTRSDDDRVTWSTEEHEIQHQQAAHPGPEYSSKSRHMICMEERCTTTNQSAALASKASLKYHHVPDLFFDLFSNIYHDSLTAIEDRIKFKIAVITHKVRSCTESHYLSVLLKELDTVEIRRLCSSGQSLLVQPFARSSGARGGFSYAAPSVWNSLSRQCRACDSVFSSKKLLKTELFAAHACH